VNQDFLVIGCELAARAIVRTVEITVVYKIGDDLNFFLNIKKLQRGFL